MKNKIYILLFIVGLSYASCKKYPEDRSISLSTVKHRLIKHHWQVKEVFYIGNNINGILNDSLQLGDIESVQLNIDYLKSEKTGTVRYSYGGNEDYFFSGGTWDVYEKKKYIFFDQATGNGLSTVSNDIKILNNLFNYNWTIIKLYKSDLKIENKKGFEISFNAIK